MPATPAKSRATAGTEDGHRVRLLDGLAAALAERSYRETTVADIVRYARTSKRTFYAHYPDKEACLLELLDTDNIRMIANIRGAVDPAADWDVQVEQAVDAYISSIEERPAITLAWIRELPALGYAARPMQRRGMGRFTDLLVDISSGPGFRRAHLPPVSRTTAIILLGGLRELTAFTMEDGDDIREIAGAATAACIGLVQPPR